MNVQWIVCVACGVALNLAAGRPRVTRAIDGASDDPVVVSVALDDHVFANSLPAWADVRVLDSEGHEVPRVILPARTYVFEQRHTSRAAKLKRVEQRPDGGLAVMCEIERTNALSLTQVTVRTPLRNYEQTLTVFVPGPDDSWRPVQAAEPLFDYSRFADVKKDSVELPAVTNRLFKLVIGQADDTVFSAYTSMTEERDSTQAVQRVMKRYSVESRPFRIDSIVFRDTERVAVADAPQTERIAVPSFTVTEEPVRKQTVLTVKAEQWPLIGVAFCPAQQNFERKVEVECSAPGGWRPLARGLLTRSRLPDAQPVDHLEIVFPETRADQLRVLVNNDDNPPLTFEPGAVTCLRKGYRVSFIAEKDARYRLAYGNPDVAAAPVYEQGVLAYLNSGQRAVTWTLSAAPEGPIVVGTPVRLRRFFVRHGMLLASLVVMAVLAVLILRAVRHVNDKA